MNTHLGHKRDENQDQDNMVNFRHLGSFVADNYVISRSQSLRMSHMHRTIQCSVNEDNFDLVYPAAIREWNGRSEWKTKLNTRNGWLEKLS